MATEPNQITWITLLPIGISIFALLRPEIFRGFGRFINKVDFYPTGLIEVGFTQFGPTIGILGTLRANYDQFIHGIKLKVTRVRDGATNNFVWAVNRPLSTMPNPQGMTNVVSFSLAANVSQSGNILFQDQVNRSRMDVQLNTLTNLFVAYLQGKGIAPATLDGQQLQAEYQIFQKDNAAVTNIYSELFQIFYWESGPYKIEMQIETHSPNKIFSKTILFDLDDSDIPLLRNNIIWMMLSACNIPINWSFALKNWREPANHDIGAP